VNRLEKLLASLPQELDGLYITNEKNIFYLTGFSYTDGYLLVTREESYLMTDFRYIEAAKVEAGNEWKVIMFSQNRKEQLSDLLSQNKVRTLGFEGMTLSYEDYETLEKNNPSILLKKTVGIIEALREFKDESEISDIITAQRIAEKAFDYMLEFIKPEYTETELALELEYQMRKLGAQASAFDIIAVSGKASSMPHGVPRNVKLEKGFLTFDFGAVYNNYRSDMTRTICIGKADDEMKKVYDTVLEAQNAVLDTIKKDSSLFGLDKVARDIIYRDYKGCFGHGLGHGVGLDIHENPRLSPTAGNKKLTKGHVVTVEPGIYIEGKYGVRIEDMVIYGSDGVKNITVCPKKLIEL